MIELGNLKLYNDDCMNVMKNYPDNYFSIAIVDPPYGIKIDEGLSKGWASKSGGTKFELKEWDSESPDEKYFKELMRVSKNVIIWGANHFIKKMPFNSSCWIVWDKNNGKSFFADAELAYTDFKKTVKIVKVHWCGSAAVHETGRNKIHPTQKPIELYNWILNEFSKPENKILDTHLGSGSNAIANHYFGTAEFVGVELDQDYFNDSIKRIKRETSQMTLF